MRTNLQGIRLRVERLAAVMVATNTVDIVAVLLRRFDPAAAEESRRRDAEYAGLSPDEQRTRACETRARFRELGIIR